MAPTIAPKARPHLARMLAERKKMHLTRGDNGAPGGIRTPNLLIRRSTRGVSSRTPRSVSRGKRAPLVPDRLAPSGRVAVSVAVSLRHVTASSRTRMGCGVTGAAARDLSRRVPMLPRFGVVGRQADRQAVGSFIVVTPDALRDSSTFDGGRRVVSARAGLCPY